MARHKQLFFDTPQDKLMVFQKPRLVMFSDGLEVASWNNTQPLYFYPFSWLDFLNGNGVKELYLCDYYSDRAKQEIELLDTGKVHFEEVDERLIQFAKERGHKVSVICNLEDLFPQQIRTLSIADFVKIRVCKDFRNLSILSGLPNEHTLSCIKAYAGCDCDYLSLATQVKDMGIDFLHVSKKLLTGSVNSIMPPEEKQRIEELSAMETNRFKIIIPSSLDHVFANRFKIDSTFGNVYSCQFSKHRMVLSGNEAFPCYTQSILADTPHIKKGDYKPEKRCSDCACIYENDMLADIKSKMTRYKNPRFALEYKENGR